MAVSFLRTISTPRLAALCASVAAVAAGGTAIAVAGGSDPVPPPKPLASAVHDGLTAPEVQGITARVKFTNHLIDSSGIHGGSPLLSGATGRLWLSPGHALRLELQSEGSSDSQLVVDKSGFWVYDGSANTVYKGKLPRERGRRHAERSHKVPSVARIQRGLNRARGHKLDISGPVPGNIAGQPAYTVRVGPGRPGGLLGAVELAWDAARGLPLRVAVYARGNSDPVLELVATDVQYGPVPASDFAISPPADAKVVDVAPRRGAQRGQRGHARKLGGLRAAKKLPFTVSAPGTLAGRKRSAVRVLQFKHSRAALIRYGRGLDAILVVEKRARPEKPQQRSGHHGQLELPTVNVNGATAKVIDTPLGSVVSFERGGVSYTVLGSVRASVAESAARGL
jgi:outer membrane lipoprotein-sorting protein